MALARGVPVLAGASAIALVIALAAAPVRAQPSASAEADALIEQGLSLRSQRNDAEALPYFQRAYGLAHTPRAAAQLGFVEQAVGDWPRAELHLGEALAAVADAWVTQRRTLIEESLRFVRSHLGALALETNVPGAAIFVDAEDRGRAPLSQPLRLASGRRNVELRAAGYRPITREVAITPGKTARLHVELALMESRRWAASPLPPRLSGLPPPSLATAASDGNATPPAFYQRWWFWTGIGVVAAGIAAIAVITARPRPYTCGADGRVCLP